MTGKNSLQLGDTELLAHSRQVFKSIVGSFPEDTEFISFKEREGVNNGITQTHKIAEEENQGRSENPGA